MWENGTRLPWQPTKSAVLRSLLTGRFISTVPLMTGAIHCAIYANRQVLNAPACVLFIQPFGQLAKGNIIRLCQIGVWINDQRSTGDGLINVCQKMRIFGQHRADQLGRV